MLDEQGLGDEVASAAVPGHSHEDDEHAEQMGAGQVDEAPVESGVPDVVRFHLVPRKGWDRFMRGMRCSARNFLTWKGSLPIPSPPAQGRPCWLLATSDETSLCIAKLQHELRAAGWKIITSEPHVVLRLGNKAMLRDHAQTIGLSEHLPTPYTCSEDAEFPCILKSATGEFGKDCHIVESIEDIHRLAPKGLGSKWILQELTYGRFEYSVSLLVLQGRILYTAGTKYEYGSEAYVYPNVQKIGKEPYEAPAEHLAVMTALLEHYSGICNFNYKIQDSGALSIFEVNTRVGGDLAVDVPRARARSLFEALDNLLEEAECSSDV